ncbi:hypothetical protein Sez_0274 [Streptococcus equi subsp. zooepidemicus MGCS10565]|uniref:Uncharacterized protein n=1 Tax=Streptococcus equi subsp. zooepidemicus (strain MGCS10565) TaxID=552526 RepID=B4U0W5_STREM|nr:hypothetical protein Sez_0274 [Streptococcus equi subsp. zooepidemicus MGCS10565]
MPKEIVLSKLSLKLKTAGQGPYLAGPENQKNETKAKQKTQLSQF